MGQIGYREMLTLRMFGVAAIVSCLYLVVLAMVGAFESHHVLSLRERLAYNLLIIPLCLFIGYAAFVFAIWVTRSRSELQTILALAVMVLASAAPCTGIAYAVYGLYVDQHLAVPPAHDSKILVTIYLSSVVLLLCAGTLVYYVLRLRVEVITSSSITEPTNQEKSAAEVFVARLPEQAGSDIVYLTASGHYVNVVTTTGKAVVLMRLRDAINELGDVGMQVHRSCWVAHDHVDAIEQDGPQVSIRLSNGDTVPVSNPFRIAIRQRYDGLSRSEKRSDAS